MPQTTTVLPTSTEFSTTLCLPSQQSRSSTRMAAHSPHRRPLYASTEEVRRLAVSVWIVWRVVRTLYIQKTMTCHTTPPGGTVPEPSTTARLNFRVRPKTERRLRAAADALGLTLTDFVIAAAELRADDVLATRTVVPADFYDALLRALDQPWPSGGRLSDAAQLANKIVRQA